MGDLVCTLRTSHFTMRGNRCLELVGICKSGYKVNNPQFKPYIILIENKIKLFNLD